MSEACPDEQVTAVMLGLLRCRRALDPGSFNSLLGALQVEIQLGLDVAEEQAIERAFRRRCSGTVLAFPAPEAAGAKAVPGAL